jgi:formate dehydrogenase maturation protein FdhE
MLSLLRLALLPSLANVSQRLDRSRTEGLWDRGDCPNCGSEPVFAESRGLEQRIFFRCGLCAADWAGERIGCPACTENRSRFLRVEAVDGEQEKCRLVHCHSCRYHWRVVSTLTPLSAPAMIVANLATIHLELMIEESRATPD